MSNSAPISLEQLFRYYRGLPHQTASIQQLEQDLAVNGYAIAMRRDPEFKKAVDEIMAGLLKGGEAEKLYQQWFMSTIPPGINLQVPLSAALREAFANPTDKGVAEPE